MALLFPLRGERGGVRLFSRDAGAGPGSAQERSAAAGRQAAGRPRLVPVQRHAGDDALPLLLCRHPQRGEGEAALSEGVRGKLPASHAPAGLPRGQERRGVCGVRLPPGTARPGYHGGPGGPGRRLPEAGHRPLPGLCPQPHQRGSPLGPGRPGGGSGGPWPVFLLRQLGHPRSV